MRLITVNVFPPIPMRCFDWQAYDEDKLCCDECPSPTIGYGPTELDAIVDWLEREWEKVK